MTTVQSKITATMFLESVDLKGGSRSAYPDMLINVPVIKHVGGVIHTSPMPAIAIDPVTPSEWRAKKILWTVTTGKRKHPPAVSLDNFRIVAQVWKDRLTDEVVRREYQ